MSEVLVDHNHSSPWWQRVRDACSQSEQNCAAYITTLVCRQVSNEFTASQTKAKDPDADTASDKEGAEEEEEEEKGDDKDNDKATEKPEDKAKKRPAQGDKEENEKKKAKRSEWDSWENLSVDMAHWELLLKQLEDTLALSTLLHIRIPDSDRSEVEGEKDVEASKELIRVSVTRLLDGGKGSISHLVARYVASQGLGSKSLYKMPVFDEGESPSPSPEQESSGLVSAEEEQKLHSMTRLERLQSYLEELKKRFPNSLDNDILLSNCAWEYAVLWNKDAEEVKNLQLSLDYLKLVQNAVLRQGVSSMLWHMFVVKRMSAAAQLMEKVGKAPKDRLCRKDVNMSDKSLTAFCGSVVELLNIIMEANCEANETPVFNTEHNWQGVRGPASLGELAVDAKPTNYGLVRLHWLLALLMHALMVFSMKGVKVLSLFCRRGKAAFFKDLHAHPLLPSKTVDDELATERQTVLAKIVTHAIEGLGEPAHEPRPLHKRINMFSFYWPRTCMTLADDLGVDEEKVRRHYVIELYNYGHDDLARSIHGLVTDEHKFARQMLLVAGKRTAYRAIHEHPKQMPRLLGEMTPVLSRWLQQMDMNKLGYKLAPLEDNLSLLREAAAIFPNSGRDTELTLDLIEFTELLITLKISVEPQTEDSAIANSS